MTKYILMVFGGACSFGILSTFVKLANRDGYTAAGISFLQASIGMLVLWAIVFFSGKNKIKGELSEPLWPILLTGAAIGLTTFVYYVSVQFISASLAVVLLMQFAWIGVGINWWLFKERPGNIQLFTVVMIMAGTILASGIMESESIKISFEGICYALTSAVLYSIYIAANGRVAKDMDPVRKSAIIMTGSAAGILIVNANDLLSPALIDVTLLKWATFLSLFGTIIPPVLFAKGIPKIGAGLSSVIMTAELPVAVIFAHMLLGEQLTGTQWTGILIMLLALVILNSQKIDRLKNGIDSWRKGLF